MHGEGFLVVVRAELEKGSGGQSPPKAERTLSLSGHIRACAVGVQGEEDLSG